MRFEFRAIYVAVALAVISAGPALGQQKIIAPALDQEQLGVVPDAMDEQHLPDYRPQPAYFRPNEAAGTFIIQTEERFLYLVQGPTMAIRYGIGVGRDGFQWSGRVRFTRKQEWPDWRPPRTSSTFLTGSRLARRWSSGR